MKLLNYLLQSVHKYRMKNVLKLGWYLQLEECSMIRQSRKCTSRTLCVKKNCIQIYSQSSQTVKSV